MHALVLGPTGATGQELLRVLLQRQQWERVTTVHRRKFELPPELQQYAAKLEQVVVDMEQLERDAAPAFAGADAVFCALGTTRKAAGSAAAFRRVDLDYVAAAAAAAAAGRRAALFSLVSSQGANAAAWASDAAPFHSLLYVQTKGKAEEAAKSAGVPLVSIFRPGLLGRGSTGEKRVLETLAAKLLSPLPVATLAEAMVADAEARVAQRVTGSGQGDVRSEEAVAVCYSNNDIRRLASALSGVGLGSSS